MKKITFSILTMSLLILTSCIKFSSKNNNNNVLSSITSNLSFNIKRTLNTFKKGNYEVVSEMKFEQKFSSTNYQINLLLKGFSSPIADTLNQVDFRQALAEIVPPQLFKRDSVEKSIELKAFDVEADSGLVKLRYKVFYQEFNHDIEYRMHVKDAQIIDKDFSYLTTYQNKTITSSNISVTIK